MSSSPKCPAQSDAQCVCWHLCFSIIHTRFLVANAKNKPRCAQVARRMAGLLSAYRCNTALQHEPSAGQERSQDSPQESHGFPHATQAYQLLPCSLLPAGWHSSFCSTGLLFLYCLVLPGPPCFPVCSLGISVPLRCRNTLGLPLIFPPPPILPINT